MTQARLNSGQTEIQWNWYHHCESVRRSTLSSKARLVIRTLADHADRTTGRCWPSLPTLVRESGLSKDSVRRALTELDRGGWFASWTRSCGLGHSSEYVLRTAPATSEQGAPCDPVHDERVAGCAEKVAPCGEKVAPCDPNHPRTTPRTIQSKASPFRGMDGRDPTIDDALPMPSPATLPATSLLAALRAAGVRGSMLTRLSQATSLTVELVKSEQASIAREAGVKDPQALLVARLCEFARVETKSGSQRRYLDDLAKAGRGEDVRKLLEIQAMSEAYRQRRSPDRTTPIGELTSQFVVAGPEPANRT